MNPVCPVCGAYLVIVSPPSWTPESSQWVMLLIVRHVLKKHPEWLDQE